MPVTVAAFSPSQSTAQGAISLAWPAGHQAGDIGLIIHGFQMTAAATASPAIPAGWTQIPDAATRTTVSPRIRMFWKRAASSSESNVSLPYASMTIQCARMIVLRGCWADGDPFKWGTNTPTGGLGGAYSQPGMQAKVDGALAIHGAFQVYDSTSTIFSGWDAMGVGAMDELFDACSTTGSGACLAAATIGINKDDVISVIEVASSQGIAYSYRCACVAAPAEQSPTIIPQLSSTNNAGGTSLNCSISAGAAEAGELLIIQGYSIHTAYRTLSWSTSGGAQQFGTKVDSMYNYSSNFYVSRIMGWAVATGAAQTFTLQSTATSNNLYVQVYRIPGFKDPVITDAQVASGTNRLAINFPALAAGNFHIHAASYTSDTGTYGIPSEIGWISDWVNQVASYGDNKSFLFVGGLSSVPKEGPTMAIEESAFDRSWQTISGAWTGAWGIAGGGGGGAGGGLFWGNNF